MMDFGLCAVDPREFTLRWTQHPGSYRMRYYILTLRGEPRLYHFVPWVGVPKPIEGDIGRR